MQHELAWLTCPEGIAGLLPAVQQCQRWWERMQGHAEQARHARLAADCKVKTGQDKTLVVGALGKMPLYAGEPLGVTALLPHAN